MGRLFGDMGQREKMKPKCSREKGAKVRRKDVKLRERNEDHGKGSKVNI